MQILIQHKQAKANIIWIGRKYYQIDENHFGKIEINNLLSVIYAMMVIIDAINCLILAQYRKSS